jgi:hypothetical protein
MNAAPAAYDPLKLFLYLLRLWRDPDVWEGPTCPAKNFLEDIQSIKDGFL